MSGKYNFFKFLFSTLVVVSIIFMNVSVALADDNTPQPQETATTEPTEQVDVTETPAPEETPSIEAEETVIPTSEVEESATPVVELTPTPESDEATSGSEEISIVEEQAPVEEEASDIPLFEQVPEGTEVVVLDENGESIPLATQEALDTILDTDPMWCPVGVLPGGAGCTQNFATINALLQNMRNNTSNYLEDGTIYFTANAGGSFSLTNAGSSLGNSDFNAMNDYNLTLQGGWNGSTSNPQFNGQTNFGSNTLTIGTSSNPWVGNITIYDFGFSNVSNGDAVTVYTTSGDITLNNVTVNQQRGDDHTANLVSQDGDITVTNSLFDGNDSGGSNNRNDGFVASTNTGSITISNTTFKDSRDCGSFWIFCIDATENQNGAILSAPIVTLTNVSAYNNDQNGIEINNANTIWLNNVNASNNGTSFIFFGTGSGIDINGTGSTVVYVNGGTLSNNEEYGLNISNGTISPITDPDCNNNRYPGPHPSQCYNQMPADTTPPVLNLPANITTEATGPTGALVTYSATATDAVDGSLSVTCSPTSGITFPLGTTTVTCSATDTHSNTASGSFTVTVGDTTPPVIAPHVNIIDKTDNASGMNVAYTPPSTFDLADGGGVATCTPASGSEFPIGTTTVTCTAQDSHGNIATPVTFLVTVKYTGTTVNNSQGGFLTTVTGGQLIDLECNMIVNAFGVRVTFYNLCDHQAVMDDMATDTLPEALPSGYAFVKGLNITVLYDGNIINKLPTMSGVQLDFPITANTQDQYAVLLWDNENSEWLDVTQLMKDEDLAEMLSTDGEDDLYQIIPTETTKALYRILSTEKIGTFVIVKK